MNNNIFNKKRFAQLLKINWMLSRSAYLSFLITMLILAFLGSYMFEGSYFLRPFDGSTTILVDPNYRGNYLIVMTIILFTIGSNTFKYLGNQIQPIQTLLPVSTFERYLICIIEFLAAFFIGIIIISIFSAATEHLSQWRYSHRDIVDFQVVPFTFSQLFESIGVFMQTLIGFAAFYFLVVAVRLFNSNKTFWKVTMILFVILCVLVLVYLAADIMLFGIPKSTGDRLLGAFTDDSETVYMFFNFTAPIVLIASIWTGYYKLKNKEQ